MTPLAEHRSDRRPGTDDEPLEPEHNHGSSGVYPAPDGIPDIDDETFRDYAPVPAAPRRRWRRWVAALLLLGLLTAGGVWWFWPAEVPPAVARVGRGDVELLITATGTLEPRRSVEVGAQVSGQVKHIHVQIGDTVKRGQLLLEIDPDVQQAVVDASRAGLASLQAQLVEQRAQEKQARRQLRRRRQLLKQQAVNEEDVENAESQFEMAQARIASLQARMQETRATLRAEETKLSYTRIYAPMDGTVIGLDAREGQTVNAAYQTPRMMRIADLGTMTVRTHVSEADVQGVHAGMPVWFSPLTARQGHEEEAPRRWHGTVRQVLPAPDQPAGSGEGGQDGGSAGGSPVVTYTALFDVDNADGLLRPRMTAQVSFVARSAPGVLTVPMAALIRLPEKGPGYYMAQVQQADGQMESRTVRIGVTDLVQGEVLEGLDEGDEVLLNVAPAEDEGGQAATSMSFQAG